MTVDIDGKIYYPMHQFAEMTNRSVATIRHLMFKGNRLRKLMFIEVGHGKYFIPIEEYHNFPFTSSGRFAGDKVYYYDKNSQYTQYTEAELQTLERELKQCQVS